ncbi:MAG: 1-(5-phosphoribosyl)-5-[(5-phosphoribosylamino)methylideneamino]imidazole-4-carboxamide isomerase [Clostridia bacterium]|nr:1-(5-phosphoribosyl)-5-[(5-phosphoribosylamino)methylideneamino]imidazole-4-carboxamide isomerase [Clostridia bacterium]
MILYPAIDLLNGQVVRLLKGDYDQVTVYDEDPVHAARVMQEAGASWLHIVDLNAAKAGGQTNLAVIAKIAAATGLRIQNGGGIRSLEALEARFAAGVTRAVLGTAAIEEPEFVAGALRRYGDRIAIGLDCLGQEVRIHGWTRGGKKTRDELVLELKELGAKTLIYTDISRDGALAGPSFDSTEELIRTSGLDVILSGGVHAESDLQRAREIGASGAIIGRAYYEGKIDLASCITKYERESV